MTDQELKELAAANLMAIKELRESQRESYKELRESQRESYKELRESQRESYQELRESQKETSMQMKETDKQMQAVAKKLDTLSTQYGGLSNNIGSVAENFFFTGLQSSKKMASISLDTIDRNVKCWNNEYDIIGVNGESVVLVSVKHVLRKNQVEKFVNKELKQFVKDFPRYKNHKIYGAVAGMDIQKDAAEVAIKSGIFVLTQVGKDIKILNAKTFKPKAV